MTTFVLAHLSDPHLGPLPRPRLHELLGKRATGYANWLGRRSLVHRSEVLARIVADLKAQAPDHIAVTGDLVNLSLAREYPAARAWIAALGPPQDVTVVPGNHDIYVRGARAQPRLHWGDYMAGDAAPGSHGHGFPSGFPPGFPFMRQRGPLALIGLSSAVPTAPFMATGELGAEQLRRLPALLDQSRDQGLFRVVMIHHPPVITSHYKRLTDAAAFRDLLARHGAELVVHGHDHVGSLVWLDGGRGGRIPAVGVPSASEAPPGEHDCAGYNLYTIDRGADGWRCELWSRGVTASGDHVVERNRMMLVGN